MYKSINIDVFGKLNMRQKIILLLLITLLASCSKEPTNETERPSATQSSVVSLQASKFKLYKTQNMWTFLKLDTSTGQIWQVQYSTKGEEYRFETPLSLDKLNTSGINGRYELYDTDNIYNFVMLDQFDGMTYQVQWSGDVENRFVIPIQ